MSLQSYRDLEVWQRSIDLVESVYKLTKNFPIDERFGLVSQARRAASSIPANIAEGYGRSHRGDYLRFLSIARGSVAELETHIIIATRVGCVDRYSTREAWEISQEVARMLSKLVSALQKKDPKP